MEWSCVRASFDWTLGKGSSWEGGQSLEQIPQGSGYSTKPVRVQGASSPTSFFLQDYLKLNQMTESVVQVDLSWSENSMDFFFLSLKLWLFVHFIKKKGWYLIWPALNDATWQLTCTVRCNNTGLGQYSAKERNLWLKKSYSISCWDSLLYENNLKESLLAKVLYWSF